MIPRTKSHLYKQIDPNNHCPLTICNYQSTGWQRRTNMNPPVRPLIPALFAKKMKNAKFIDLKYRCTNRYESMYVQKNKNNVLLRCAWRKTCEVSSIGFGLYCEAGFDAMSPIHPLHFDWLRRLQHFCPNMMRPHVASCKTCNCWNAWKWYHTIVDTCIISGVYRYIYMYTLNAYMK